MRLNYIANAIGIMMMYSGLFLLTPIAVAIFYNETASIIPFLTAAII